MSGKSEEKMLPLVRAAVAKGLLQMGFRVRQVSLVLQVTPAAVTQYSKGVRGKDTVEVRAQKRMIDGLVEKAAQRIRTSMEPLGTMEMLDAAHQILAFTNGKRVLGESSVGTKNSKFIDVLKARLQLELKAAEKCLDLSSRAREDYTRLLLRMVASDSIRHADIVSQVVALLEGEHEMPDEEPDEELLKEIMSIEDSASELSLRKTVRVNHMAARLLLESIDMDEEKHERLIGKLAQRSSHTPPHR